MMDKSQKQTRKRDSYFLLLSLFVHFLAVIIFTQSKMRPVPPQSTKVEVEYLSPDELTPPEEEAVKAERSKDPVKNQVVEAQKRLNEEKDKDTRFLSEFDQKVLKQTRAERTGQFKNTAEGGQPDEGTKDGEKKEKPELERSARKRDPGELPTLRELTPKFALNPGPKALEKTNPGDPSQTDDYLKDVQSGLQTLLSTREFIYFSYYNRIKEALRNHWEPNVREKVKIIYRKGRNIASAKDRVTQVMVVLDKKGELIRVEIIGRSGVESLDAAAVEAFKDAAPFPNPPQGMVEPDGTIKIRWDFVLEASVDWKSEGHIT